MTVISPLSFSQICLSVNKSNCKINVDIYTGILPFLYCLAKPQTHTCLALNAPFCSQIVLAILDHFSFMPISLLEQLLTS